MSYFDLAQGLHLDLADALQGNINWHPFRTGIEIYRIHGDGTEGAASALLRYAPGARLPSHEHCGHEHILVLSGSQYDEQGRYPTGTLTVNAPGSGAPRHVRNRVSRLRFVDRLHDDGEIGLCRCGSGHSLFEGKTRRSTRTNSALGSVARQLILPTLLVHGTADTVVPVEMGQTLAKRLVSVTVKWVPGANHNDLYDVGGSDLIRKIPQFASGKS